MRNEIGLMEENLQNLIGQQLHLEITDQGVYDYEVVKLFNLEKTNYLLALRISEEREGYLMKFEDLGDDWYTLCDIEDDAEWQHAKSVSNFAEETSILHR